MNPRMFTPRMFLPALLILAGGLAGAADGARGTLELIPAQPVCAAEVAATGRVLPLFSARLGCRLSADIVDWGVNDANQPLDTGMGVKTGQKLFAVDPGTFQPRVTAGEAAVAELEARLKDKQADEQRFQRLVEVDKTVPLKRLEEVRLEAELIRQQLKSAQASLEAARLDLRDTVVRAPFDGVITQRMKGLGDHVSGVPLVEVLELTTVDRLEAELRLPEAYLALVEPGVTTLRLGSPLLKAELELPVTRVVRAVDAASGTFVLRVAIPPEKRAGLVPGAFVTGRVVLPEQDQPVLVPQRAVLRGGAEPAVMVAAGGVMARRPVELGSELTEGIIIKRGLKPGETVVCGPADQLKDGAPLPKEP